MAHKNSSNWSPYKARQKKKKGLSPSSQLRGRHKKPQKVYCREEANDRLYDLFRNHGFADYPHSKRMQLVDFYLALMSIQKDENFTRLVSLKDIGIKHFIDSLMVPRLTPLKFPLLDMGTGPGLPGIPLKIEFPDEKILLAEGVQKRVEFLKQVRQDLQLKKLDILGKNINEEFVYPVQGVITRAVEDAQNTLRNVQNCVQTGGRVYLMKGPDCDYEVEEAEKNWNGIWKLVEDIHYDLPQTHHKRRLLVYEKRPSESTSP